MARRAEPVAPKRAPRPERVAAFGLGLSAESRAAAYLVAKGYRILARRWKSPVGELDIVARRRQLLVFVEVKARTSLDAARILSRLMRRMDFASLQADGSIIAAFAETDLRMANVIVRRLASVLKHTMLSADDKTRMDPHVTLATLKANDSAEALLERLQNGQRAAS